MKNIHKKSLLSAVSVILLSLSAWQALALATGDPAPMITAVNQSGAPVKLADSLGKFVLLYFYPMDETPGCTKEACTLRDKYDKIKALNTVVYGVSRQDQKSHQEFKNKHKLPFDLLVDTDGEIAKAFGVGSMLGMAMSHRDSILIGPDGKIRKIYRDVDPGQHADQIIADISAASGK